MARLPRQRNVHLVVTEPGHVRGNHYHEARQRGDRGVRPGPVPIPGGGRGPRLRDPRRPGVSLPIPPGIPHAFRNTGTAPQVLIGFNTEPHDPARPDVVRVV